MDLVLFGRATQVVFLMLQTLPVKSHDLSWTYETTNPTTLEVYNKTETKPMPFPAIRYSKQDSGENFSLGPRNLTATEEPLSVTLSVAEEASHMLAYRIGVYIHFVWLPIIVAVGSVGNILSLLVMMQPHNRRISCCVYMASLAMSDTMMLYIALHYFTVGGVVRDMYNMECVILATLFQMFSLTGILIVLSMTVDRFIAIRFPFKASTLCTPRRARIMSVAILVFSGIYSAPFFATSGLSNPTTCLAVKSKTTFALALSWVNTVINSVVPFIALLVLNTLIIKTIKARGKYFSHSKQDVTRTDSKDSTSKDRSNKDAQLIAMLLAVTFVLLTLTLPQYIRYVIAGLVDYTSDAYSYSSFMLFVQITNKLYFTNNGINFFLYCIGGSKFREDLTKLCCKSKKKSESLGRRGSALTVGGLTRVGMSTSSFGSAYGSTVAMDYGTSNTGMAATP